MEKSKGISFIIRELLCILGNDVGMVSRFFLYVFKFRNSFILTGFQPRLESPVYPAFSSIASEETVPPKSISANVKEIDESGV